MRWLLAGVILSTLLGCATSIPRRDPKVRPFPSTVRPKRAYIPGAYSLEQIRCFGGGIGGCSLSGRAER